MRDGVEERGTRMVRVYCGAGAPGAGVGDGPRVGVGIGRGVAVGSAMPRRWQACNGGVASTAPVNPEARRRNSPRLILLPDLLVVMDCLPPPDGDRDGAGARGQARGPAPTGTSVHSINDPGLGDVHHLAARGTRRRGRALSQAKQSAGWADWVKVILLGVREYPKGTSNAHHVATLPRLGTDIGCFAKPRCYPPLADRSSFQCLERDL